MIRDDKAYLKHILDAINFAEKHCEKVKVGDFYKNELLQKAMVRELEIIGEAANLISKKTKIGIPGIPWNKVIGMRNKLIHEYFGVDLNVVWTTIKEALPTMKKEIKIYLKKS